MTQEVLSTHCSIDIYIILLQNVLQFQVYMTYCAGAAKTTGPPPSQPADSKPPQSDKPGRYLIYFSRHLSVE